MLFTSKFFRSKNPSYEHLRKKWITKHKNLVERVVDKHKEVGRHLALTGVGGMMLLTMPATPLLAAHNSPSALHDSISSKKDKNAEMAGKLREVLPKDEVRKLNDDEEQKVSQILTSEFGMSVKPEIEGKRLNRSYGLMGGEQHLYRYPGDSLDKHSESAEDWAMYHSSGIAPGLGAWGYFAPSETALTQKDKDRERYYIAVQTFLAPGFVEHTGEYRDFFKYRKMLIVNPKTGQACVTDIADAGPAEFTGKHLGGSPEVMEAVGLAKGPRKGAVLYFFIDDPNDQIPLGPVEVK